MEPKYRKEGIPIVCLLKALLFSYLLTAILLALIAFLLYISGLEEKVVRVAITAVYVVATFFAGFLVGKSVEQRKFIWGFLIGSAYFLILVLLSLALRHFGTGSENSPLTTYVLCAVGGTLGGMLS